MTATCNDYAARLCETKIHWDSHSMFQKDIQERRHESVNAGRVNAREVRGVLLHSVGRYRMRSRTLTRSA